MPVFSAGMAVKEIVSKTRAVALTQVVNE